MAFIGLNSLGDGWERGVKDELLKFRAGMETGSSEQFSIIKIHHTQAGWKISLL